MIDTSDAVVARNLRESSYEMLLAARARHLAERNLCRPSVQLCPDLSSYACSITGNEMWQASYGELIVTGRTPEEAFQEFDHAWQNGQDEGESPSTP